MSVFTTILLVTLSVIITYVFTCKGQRSVREARVTKETEESITIKRPPGLTRVEEPQFLKLRDAFRDLCESHHGTDIIDAERKLNWYLEHYQNGPLAATCKEVVEKAYSLFMKREMYDQAESWVDKWNLS